MQKDIKQIRLQVSPKKEEFQPKKVKIWTNKKIKSMWLQ